MKHRAVIVMAVILAALGVVLVVTTRSRSAPEQRRQFVWSADMDTLARISILLPREGGSGAWVLHEDGYWYFDTPGGPQVDLKRWGGGVPLLLSGPGANRLITESVTAEQMKVYGLADPQMRIGLKLKDGTAMNIDVGDGTPDGQAYYLKLTDSTRVYTVDYTWFDVLAGLVRNPPYPPKGQ